MVMRINPIYENFPIQSSKQTATNTELTDNQAFDEQVKMLSEPNSPQEKTNNLLSNQNMVDGLNNSLNKNQLDIKTHTLPDISNKADFTSGQVGIDLDGDGRPSRVLYFDLNGEKLTTSGFSATAILRLTDKFNIDINAFNDLADQLDAEGVDYKPYELFKGTGSDHGIDLKDLASGGMGTAYDWTRDNAQDLKGISAVETISQNLKLVDRLGIEKTSVTSEKGIDPSRFEVQNLPFIGKFNHVAWSDSVAGWYQTVQEAEDFAKNVNGSSKSLDT